MVNVKFKTMERLRTAEPWLWGKVELYALITIANNTSDPFQGLTKTAGGSRKDFRDCNFWGNCFPVWRNINAEILTWDEDEIGNRMKYNWYEVDNSPIEKITLSATVKFGPASVTGSAAFNINEKRLNLGDSYVEYCDNTDGNGTLYSPGTFIQFHVKQQ